MTKTYLSIAAATLLIAGCTGGRPPADSTTPPDDGGTPPVAGESVFMSIVPAGSNGNSAGGVGTPAGDGGTDVTEYPDNYRDQLDLYGNLAYAQQGLKADECVPPNSIAEHAASSDQACNYFKPGGLTPTTVTSSFALDAPDGGTVTVERDGWGVPFITGSDRQAAQYGLGYAAAQDRLWLFDVLRYVGRGESSRILGPAETTYDLDLEFGVPGGYSEDELTMIVDSAVSKTGDLGQLFLQDVESFVAGMNAYIADLLGPRAAEVPPEYQTLGFKTPPPFPPRDFTVNDIVANAVLIQAALGLGGGGEATNLKLLQTLDESIGPDTKTLPTQACKIWRDLRQADAADTYHTASGTFATQSPATINESCPQSLPAGVALWDGGSLQGRPLLQTSASASVPLTDTGGLTGAALPTADAPDSALKALSKATLAKPASTWHTASADGNALKELLAKYGLPRTTSNFIAAAADQTEDGYPIMVGGPQTGYFQPQLLWEASIVSNGGTPLDWAARGIATVNLPYIVIGHGTDFAWSPTSAGSDFTDIRVSKLCNTDGSDPSRDDANGDGFLDADGYLFKGQCVRLYRRVDEWEAVVTPASLALGGPPNNETVRRYIVRTHYGPVIATATVNGAPVAISTQRSTFMADVDTAVPFALLTTQGETMTHQRFKQLFNTMTSTFNWFYVDRQDIAYYQSGLYPKRHAGVHPDLPSWGDGNYEWAVDQNLGTDFFATYGGDAADGALPFPNRSVPVAQHTPDDAYYEWPGYLSNAEHIQDTNPPGGFLANWNNSGAKGWWAADSNGSFGATHRVEMLAQRMQAFKDSGRKHTLASMIEIMGDAAYTDLRGFDTLPLLVELAESGALTDDQRAALDLLVAWRNDGSQQWINGGEGLGAMRRDRNGDGAYDHRAAVVLMDAWYPHLIETMLPQVTALTDAGASALQGRLDAPGAIGSAFQYGWFQFMQRMLETVLNKPGHVEYQALRCAGSDSTDDCRTAVLNALDQAVADLGGIAAMGSWDGTQLRDGSETVEQYDQVEATSFAYLPVPPIHWINRPTYQQAVEIRLPPR